MSQKHPAQKPDTSPALSQEGKPVRKWLPHIIAAGLFLIVTAFYFSPVMFGGKQLFQSDIVNAQGVSKEIADFRDNFHEEPYWTNSLFSGMPAYQISVHYLSSKLEYLNRLFELYLPHPAGYIFLCFIGFYFLLQVMRVDPWLSVLGAFAFGLSSYFFIFIITGHNTKIAAITYFAPLLAGIILTYRGKLLAGGAVTALFLSLEVYVNHPQMTYYFGFVILSYVLAEFYNAIRAKKIMDYAKQSGMIGIAAVIALCVNITNLWATADYSKYTIRGGTELTINPDGSKIAHTETNGLEKSYIYAYSYEVNETMTLLIPNFKGGSSNFSIEKSDDAKKALAKLDPQEANIAGQIYPQYFGTMNFTTGTIYAGAIIVFLFVLGLFIVKGPLKWALAFSTVLSIWLSWGKNDPFGFSDFMVDHFPAYNKFRAVVTILVIAELTIPLLAVLAVNELIKNKNFLKEKISMPFKQSLSGQKILIISFVLTGGIALLCWIAPGSFTKFSSSGDLSDVNSRLSMSGWPQDQIKSFYDSTISTAEEARKAIVQADAMRSFLFILLAGIIIWLFGKNKINKKVLAGSLAALVLLDMGLVDRRYFDKDNWGREMFRDKTEMKNQFTPSAADQEILKDTGPNYRVWNTTVRPDQDGSTSYFHKSLGGYHGAKLRRYQELIDFHINQRHMPVINMLNAKYFIFQGEKGNEMAYPNPDALGNAWFVNNYKLVQSPDSEITAMNNFNPKRTAIVDKKFENELSGFKPNADSSASIKLTSYKANDLIYESKSPAEGLAVFSEIYYPSGWNAYIDGKLTPHFRANYVLRALCIPAGKHNVEFKFEPEIISKGEKISMAGMIALLLFCGGALFMELKKKKNAAANN